VREHDNAAKRAVEDDETGEGRGVGVTMGEMAVWKCEEGGVTETELGEVAKERQGVGGSGKHVDLHEDCKMRNEAVDDTSANPPRVAPPPTASGCLKKRRFAPARAPVNTFVAGMFVYVCMYVHICVCVYVNTYVHIYVCIYIYIYVYICISLYIYIYIKK